jgi:hypothetical protein
LIPTEVAGAQAGDGSGNGRNIEMNGMNVSVIIGRRDVARHRMSPIFVSFRSGRAGGTRE